MAAGDLVRVLQTRYTADFDGHAQFWDPVEEMHVLAEIGETGILLEVVRPVIEFKYSEMPEDSHWITVLIRGRVVEAISDEVEPVEVSA